MSLQLCHRWDSYQSEARLELEWMLTQGWEIRPSGKQELLLYPRLPVLNP